MNNKIAPAMQAHGRGGKTSSTLLLIRVIHDSVGCAMRTEGLNGAHGAPYDQTDNLG